MGSSVSVTVANLVMEEIEEKIALSTYHTPARFWKWYIDDRCTALQKEFLSEFLGQLNNADTCSSLWNRKKEDVFHFSTYYYHIVEMVPLLLKCIKKAPTQTDT